MFPSTIDNLPVDVLSNILIRLPAKPLAQMRCVSKPWNTLLSQPAFVKSHLHRSIKNNDEILMVFANRYFSDPKLLPITAHPSKSPHSVIPNFIQIPVNPDLPEMLCYSVHGSVNGLICLSYGMSCYAEQVIQIWNPSLSAMLTLPPYANPFGCTRKIDIRFGFGLDPKTDDYKVFKFMNPKPMMWRLINNLSIDWDDNLPYEKIRVEIYSLRKCSWESITERFPPNVIRIVDSDEVCLDGHEWHLHCLGKLDDQCGKKETIIRFDLIDETFSEICLPLPVSNVNGYNDLGTMDGKLCVMSFFDDHDCEVWVMNEYAVVESWTKRYAFSQLTFSIKRYGFTYNNEFFFEPLAGYRRLALNDPSEAKVKLPRRLHSNVKIVKYVDSLVWIAPRGSAS